MIPKAVVDSASGSPSSLTRHKFKLGEDAEAEEETIEDISVETDVSMKDAFLPFDTIAEDMDEGDDSTLDATSSNVNSNTDDSVFITVPTLSSPPHKHSPRRPSALSPHRGTFYDLPSTPSPTIIRPSFLYRHVYPHRGHSRQALFQTRILWQTRKAEWKRWEDEVAEADLAARHGGIIWMPRASPALSWRSSSSKGLSLDLSPPGLSKPTLSLTIPASPPGLPLPVKCKVMAESMFPRAGDLAALRQANTCVSPDWTFRRVPLFRIHTTLFAHELRQASILAESSEVSVASCSNSPQTSPMLPYLAQSSPEIPSESEEEWDRGGSPDSDATLVDDERLPSDIDLGSPPVYSEFDATLLKEGWLARWHILAELLTSDGRPVPCSPVAVPMYGLSPVKVSSKGQVEEQETSPSEGKFDALMRMMVEDAIDAGQVDMRGRGSSSTSSSRSSSSSTRNKARFFVPDLDEDDVVEPSPGSGSKAHHKDGDDSSDDEADDYDYGEPVDKPVFARLSSQLEVRRRAQIASVA